MRIIFQISILILFFATNSFGNELVVKWNNKEGLARLNDSQYKNDFYQIADHFQPQINPLYCAIASAVIVLNTLYERQEIVSQKDLEIVKPKAFGGGNIPFNNYSQLTFLNNATDKVKDRQIITLKNITKENENDTKNFDAGLGLKQLAKILKIYQLKVKTDYVESVNQKSLESFRKLLKDILTEDKKFLLANFDGKIIGLNTRGHISPIVAFDENSDSVLVLDVAGHKNGWYFVSVADLLKAMNTKDGNNYRGYLIVWK